MQNVYRRRVGTKKKRNSFASSTADRKKSLRSVSIFGRGDFDDIGRFSRMRKEISWRIPEKDEDVVIFRIYFPKRIAFTKRKRENATIQYDIT